MSREVSYHIKIVPTNKPDADGVWKPVELIDHVAAFTWREMETKLQEHVPLGYMIVAYERIDLYKRET
ncbi:MAG: hypothetical protein V3S55_15180 [Nitrospiraceae bacterium]